MKHSLVATFLGMSLFAAGCSDSSTSSNEAESSDRIEILSAVGKAPLVDGDTVQFTVVLKHVLVSTDSGEIDIGFNNWISPDLDALVDSASRYVAAGTGIDTITVSTQVKSWGTQGAFRISAKLSEHPHPASWSTLAEDAMDLIPKQ